MPRRIEYQGKIQEFPDDATDDEIRSALEGGTPQARPPAQKQSAPSAMGKTADDYSRQILNGMTFGFGDNMEAAVNALPFLGDKRSDETYSQAYQRNLAETRGKMGDFQKENPKTAMGLEVAGSVLPAVVTAGSMTAASTAPLLARAARGAATGALYGGVGGAGNSNAGNFEDTLKAGLKGAAFGGVVGGAMPVVSAGLRHVAGDIADSALGIGMKDRKHGKTPAEAILDETNGLRASTIEDSARNRMTQLQSELAAAGQGKSVDISTAQQLAQQLADNEARGINQPLAGELGEMAGSLNAAPPNFHGATLPPRLAPGGPGVKEIAPVQSVPDVQRLKRDFSNRFVGWNSGKPATVSQAGKQVYGALDDAFDASVPEAAGLNQRISSLIPVAQRAEAKQLQAGAGQRVMHRIAAHTGAGVGAVGGYLAGGPLGGVAGLVVPELLASTPVEMGIARTMNLPSKSPAWLENLLRYNLSQGSRALPQPVTPQNLQLR